MHTLPAVLALLLGTEAAANTSSMGTGVTGVFGVQVAGTVSSAPIAPQQIETPALAQATANKARMAVRPVLKIEPDYIRPTTAIESGEYGEVFISGIIGEDGKIYEPAIKVSSRSDIIDRQALTDVRSFLFSPARDVEGHAVTIPINLSLEYGHVNFRGSNGLAQYRCNQAVKDSDWWSRTWPSDKKDRIYGTVKGMVAMQALRSGDRGATNFDGEWKAAIEACRKQPDKRFLDMLKPDGDFVRSMTKG
ncbi:energy transducer TonB [Sphingomonas sp. MMS12-HWE2-04]|uniref:energy transducer TonB n=1 Tax=Sphingomonas sp. MMS12-HWE2-04 TaxID=3234199 RepID=UPI00384E5755